MKDTLLIIPLTPVLYETNDTSYCECIKQGHFKLYFDYYCISFVIGYIFIVQVRLKPTYGVLVLPSTFLKCHDPG